MTQTTDFIDLSDHDQFLERVPYEAFAQLRHEDPVHWNAETGGPAWTTSACASPTWRRRVSAGGCSSGSRSVRRACSRAMTSRVRSS